MTLAISASAAAWATGKVTLSITGATGALPVGAPVYASAFPASPTYDSWTGGADGGLPAPSTGYLLYNQPAVGYTAPGGHDWYSELQYLSRTVTGLTIGNVYTFTVQAKVYNGPPSVLMRVTCNGITYPDPVPVGQTAFTTLTTTFTATATSHLLVIGRATGSGATILIKSATVQRISTAASSTLSITRTDTNGQHFVRRLPNVVPDASGNMTVDDYEAAYTASVYRVIDAAGNTATTTVTPTPGVADPVQIVAVGTTAVAGLSRVDGFDRSYEYTETGNAVQILGRSSPVVTVRSDNVWTLRQGRLMYWCADANEAQQVVDIYKTSRVVFLRNDEQEVADMYHVGSSIAVVPQLLAVGGWTYQVQVDYREISWPEGDMAGDSWTYDDITGGYLAYFDLPTAYATYAAMAAG